MVWTTNCEKWRRRNMIIRFGKEEYFVKLASHKNNKKVKYEMEFNVKVNFWEEMKIDDICQVNYESKKIKIVWEAILTTRNEGDVLKFLSSEVTIA